jgi:hypothetical protein
VFGEPLGGQPTAHIAEGMVNMQIQKEVLRVLKDPEVRFELCFMPRDNYGTIEAGTVKINLLKCLLPTLIHECLHHLYELYDEDTILDMEQTVYDMLSHKEKIQLLNLLMERATNGQKTSPLKKEAISG